MVENKMASVGPGSEVVTMDEKTLAAHAAREMPNINSVHVSKSTRVHIGPKIVAVNQTIENKEMVKGHIFGLELVSAKTSKRLRCSVAVFLCWTLFVATSLAVYLVYFVLHKQQVRIDIGLNASWYLRRDEWQALKTYGEDFLNLPVQYVIIGHSAENYCKEKYACVKSMLEIQNAHLKRGFDDIGPNFLVGGNGVLFEGRGANVIGAMVKYWNLRSISIMFIGDYRTNATDPRQFEHVNVLLDVLVEKFIIREDFILFGNCQVSPDTYSPGQKVVAQLSTLSHWNETNMKRCLVHPG